MALKVLCEIFVIWQLCSFEQKNEKEKFALIYLYIEILQRQRESYFLEILFDARHRIEDDVKGRDVSSASLFIIRIGQLEHRRVDISDTTEKTSVDIGQVLLLLL